MFDIVLMNPPYGDRGGTIHLRFVDQCMNMTNKQIVVMPFGFINKDNKAYNQYKQSLSKYLETVEEYDFSHFDASATIKSVGIYKFNRNKTQDNIKIKFIDGNEKEILKLTDFSNFSDYEKNITKILYEHERIPLIWAGAHDHVTEKSLNKKGIYNTKEISKLIKQNVYDNCESLRKYIDKHHNKIYFTLNNHTGLGAAKFIAAEGGKIFLSGDDILNYLYEVCKPSGYIITMFENKKAASNFKIAIQNPLLRFVLLRIQKDHNMIEKYYKHIPGDIDWSDDRVKTDEGLLEVCGCPKDKCKEYAEYCKKIIDEIKEIEKYKNEEILKENNRKKFDIILSNPPFNLGVRFFQKYFEIADKIITIQPTKWLLTNKQNKNLTNKIDKQYCEIETVNGNEHFDAGLFADVSINYIDNKKPHKLIFNNKEYNKCEEITQFSTDSLLEEFSKKINTEDSIWDHIKGTVSYYRGYEKHPNENWWIVRLSEIRGNVATKGNKESSDFYTIISKDNEFMKNNIGQYKNIKKIPTRKGKYEFGYFAFETEQELNNFIRYIKTDFVRGCLKLSKNHSNQFRGCFKTIPWFDFSDEHFNKSPREIDNWLFKKYNISDEIRKHIEEILPDYYGIRK